MYQSNWETFLEKYNQAKPELQRIIDSGDVPIFSEVLMERYGITRERKNELISLLSDILLEVITLRTGEEILRTDVPITKLTAVELIAEVSDFVKKVKEEVSQGPRSTPPVSTVTTSVPPLRTMEMDAKKIHGYGAFRETEPLPDDQPVFHSEQSKLVPPPSYHNDSSTPPKP